MTSHQSAAIVREQNKIFAAYMSAVCFLFYFLALSFQQDSVAILFIAYTGSLQAGCFNHGVVTIIDNAYELSNCIRQQAGLDQITTLVQMVLTVTCFHPCI